MTDQFKSRSIIVIPYFVGFSIGISLILSFGHGQSINELRPSHPLFAPPSFIKHFTFGFSETLADSFWLRVIQDFDYCEKSQVDGNTPSVDLNKISEEEKVRAQMPKIFEPEKALHSARSRCDRGWVYHHIDAITELAPRFRMPYSAGGTMMSILVDDREGARLIFEKGIKQFPTDWTMSYRAAYHYLYEVNNPERAAELLTLSAKNGAPPWAYALAARLYTVTGRAQLGKSVLEDALAMDPNGPGAERIRQRLDEINKILAQGEPEAGKSQ